MSSQRKRCRSFVARARELESRWDRTGTAGRSRRRRPAPRRESSWIAELLDQRAQNGEGRGLLAALLLGEKGRQRLQPAVQGGAFEAEPFPVRMGGQHGVKHLHQHLAALVERAELDLAAPRDDFERRAGGGDVPARVPFRVLVSRGKIRCRDACRVAQQVAQAAFEGNGDTVRVTAIPWGVV